MQNTNPLRIFTKDEISNLSHNTLVKYRKQKLLLFQMTEKYTVNMNGHEVDKNTVISIFADLERTLDKHLLQYKIPELQKFLSSADLSNFRLVMDIDYNSMSSENRLSVLHSIADKINRHLGSDIKYGKIGPVNTKKITEFAYKYFIGFVDRAYDNVYNELSDHVSVIAEEYDNPFKSKSGTALRPEVEKLLNGQLYDTLNALPHMFETIKISFSRWCHNMLHETFDRTTEFRKFSKNNLRSLRKAMYIAANYFQPDQHRENARLVTSYLSNSSGGSSSGGENGCSAVGIVIGIFIFIIKFSILFKDCNNSSSSRNRNNYGYSQYDRGVTNNEAYKEVLEALRQAEIKRNREGRSRNKSTKYNRGGKDEVVEEKGGMIEEEKIKPLTELYPKGGKSVQSVQVIKDYQGGNKLAINAKVKRIEHKDDLVEVYFKCDALPMYHDRYGSLVPDEVKTKYAGKIQDAVFIFEPRDLRNAVTHIPLKLDLKRKTRVIATSFGYVSKKTESAKKLNIKKLKTTDFKFKGNVRTYRLGFVKGGEQQAYKGFRLGYDRAKQSYTYQESRSPTQLIYLDGIEDESKAIIKSKDLGETRYAALINNIKNIQTKYLRQASIYTIPRSTYSLPFGKSTTERVLKIKDGILKMYISSKGDGYTYAELKMDQSQVNFVINEDGYIQTVQQVTYDKSTGNIERIIMTRE